MGRLCDVLSRFVPERSLLWWRTTNERGHMTNHLVHMALEEVLTRLVELDQRTANMERKIDRILRLEDTLLHMEAHEMATLDETLAEVTAESTKLDSIQALIDGIKAQLAAALGGALAPDVQAKVDAVFAGLTANTAKIDHALAANTPSP